MPPKARGPPSRSQFNCPDCDKPFSRKEYVERHRRLKHFGSRPFACADCGNSFARSDLLRRHRKTCASVLGAAHKVAEDGLDDDEGLAVDENDAFAALEFATAALSSAAPHPGDAFSYPSHASSSNLSPSNVPSLSPPGDSSGGSATSANSPKTPSNGLDHGPDLTLASVPSSYPSRYSDPTLAPPISHSHSHFTQDEILASEVLEDLLRSPQYSPRYTSNQESYASLESLEPSTDIDRPWHGSRAVPNAGNESAEVMGYWEGEPLDHAGGYNGIEFSPEAQALADYFNKGGVGGISALDLGFTHTPSLFPDHLFEPNVPDHEDSRFFLPSQRFCVGYLYPWSVPPIKTLSRFAKLAATSFLPSVPVVHPATMVMAEMPTHTAFALTVTGAAYEPAGETFSNEMLVEKRVFLVRGFNKPGNSDDDKFASLQSMLLYQLLGLFHKDEQQRLLSHTFHAALVMMLRQLSLPTKVRQASIVPVYAGLEGEALDAAWKAWIRVETWRRVAFIVYLSDLETATNFSAAPLLPFAELAIDLPASDKLWNATSASDWLQKSLRSPPASGVPFLDAVRALIAPSPPGAFSPDGLVLAKIGTLSAFPLLILSRTLSFLQMKTEEAIRQVDPFRALLGGVGVFDGKEEENHAVLRRIISGREVLRNLPGGIKRGGGEKWFEGVIPTTIPKMGEQRPHNNSDEDEDEPPRKRANQSPSSSHMKRAAEGIADAWPDFMV